MKINIQNLCCLLCLSVLWVPVSAETLTLESQDIDTSKIGNTTSTSAQQSSATKAPTQTTQSRNDDDDIGDTAEETTQATSSPSVLLKGEVIHISAGTSVPASIDRGINSSQVRVGDRGFAKIANNVSGIPAGSQVEFIVDYAEPARMRFATPGAVRLKAVRVIYPSGYSTTLHGEAYLVTKDSQKDHIIYGADNADRLKSTATKTAIGTAVGTVGGLMAGGNGIGGSVGKTTAIAAGIGAAVGLLSAGLTKGKDVNIPSGQAMYIKFPQSTQIQRDQGS